LAPGRADVARFHGIIRAGEASRHERLLQNRGHLLAFGLVALVAGLALAPAWGWALFSTCSPYSSFHHVRNLDRLSDWARSSLAESVPESIGAWEDVFTMLHRRKRDEVGRRRQLARLLARSRRAGRALPYGLAIVDDEYRILWCNDSSESHFGIDAERRHHLSPASCVGRLLNMSLRVIFAVN
jgi:PAS domain-containing protein